MVGILLCQEVSFTAFGEVYDLGRDSAFRPKAGRETGIKTHIPAPWHRTGGPGTRVLSETHIILTPLDLAHRSIHRRHSIAPATQVPSRQRPYPNGLYEHNVLYRVTSFED
jgi:hypothetical protein